jgi:hypothetical protein
MYNKGSPCYLQDQNWNQREEIGLVLPNAAFAYLLLYLCSPDYKGNLSLI